MPSILDRIMETKRREIAENRAERPDKHFERHLDEFPTARDFPAALYRSGEVRIIAEVKKASPSAGVLRAKYEPDEIARKYDEHGAAAVSVLTDREYFQGDLEDMVRVRMAVKCPVLRKDFILDRYQLLEARFCGADAVLLIAECLPGKELAKLHREAKAIGLHTLVELHDAEQLRRVIDCGAKVIGINNRNLHTFETNLDHTLSMITRIPIDRIIVSESGISSYADVARLGSAGIHAVLVGESLMRARNTGAALDKLRGLMPKKKPST